MNYKDYGLNRFDEIAVRSVVIYLGTLDKDKREETLAKLDADRIFFAETVMKSTEKFKKDYDMHSRISLYYKYIGQEYIEMLKTVNSDEYLENVPGAVYQYIRDCFREET